jgi:ABC-2 type transport system permease protein
MSSLTASIPSSSRTERLGLRAATIAIANEVHKGLMHAWSERLQILIELPLFVVSLLLFAFLIGRAPQIASGELDWSLDPAQVSSLLVGYGAYLFFYLQTAKLFWRLLGEIQAGTLEQVYLSPLPAWLVTVAGRVLATVVETTIVVAILYMVVFIIAPFQLDWQGQAIVPIAFIMVGSVGYSLIEGGITLIWKRVELIHELSIGIMIFFSGALIPLDSLPDWMADVGRFSPIGQGVIALRAALIYGRGDVPVSGDGSLVWQAAIGAAYLLVGIGVFSLGESIARRRGSLGRY